MIAIFVSVWASQPVWRYSKWFGSGGQFRKLLVLSFDPPPRLLLRSAGHIIDPTRIQGSGRPTQRSKDLVLGRQAIVVFANSDTAQVCCGGRKTPDGLLHGQFQRCSHDIYSRIARFGGNTPCLCVKGPRPRFQGSTSVQWPRAASVRRSLKFDPSMTNHSTASSSLRIAPVTCTERDAEHPRKPTHIAGLVNQLVFDYESWHGSESDLKKEFGF